MIPRIQQAPQTHAGHEGHAGGTDSGGQPRGGHLPQVPDRHGPQQLSRNQYVCPNCGHHFPIGAYFRLSLILDSGSFGNWTRT